MSDINVGSIKNTPASPAQCATASVRTGKTQFAALLNHKTTQSGTDLDSIFEAASKKYNVPVRLLKAVAKVESSFRSTATSSCGAMGIMQLMPATAKSLGVTDAYDPEQNIMGGAKYLGQLLQKYDGNVRLTLAAYNSGPGNVKKYNGAPPFTENYIAKVMGYCGSDLSVGVTSVSSHSSVTPKNDLQATTGVYDADRLTSLMNVCKMLLLESMKDTHEIAAIHTDLDVGI